MIKRNIVELANCKSAIQAMHKGLINCGFELEHQNELESVPDEDAIDEYIAHNYSYSELINSHGDGGDLENIFEGFYSQFGISPDQLSYAIKDKQTASEIEREFERMDDSYREQLRDSLLNDDYFWTRDSERIDSRYRRILDFGTDNSVNGGEIRTCGPQSPSTFMGAISDIFNSVDLEIDHHCSFHIHLSVIDVDHVYGTKFQASLYYYLLSQINRWPSAVVDRFCDQSWAENYYPFQISYTKKNAVAYRGKTWEFRLFGNIDNKSDALRCLTLAIESMIFAYRAKLRKETYEDLFDHDFDYFEVIFKKRSVESILRKNRKLTAIIGN